MTKRFYTFVSKNNHFNALSWGIMKALHIGYSHAGIIVEDIASGEWEVWQATKGGFHSLPFAEFLASGREIVHQKDITHLIKDEQFALGWLKGNEGKVYGYLSYVSIIWKQAAATLYDGRSSGVCSEAVAWWVHDCTTSLFFKTFRMDEVTPKHIVEFMELV